MNETNFVTRTIKKGTVKVYGRIYKPGEQHLKYDGRLDGQRFVFCLYPNDRNLLSLWGTETAARDPKTPPFGPEVVDGSLPWMWWHIREEDKP